MSLFDLFANTKSTTSTGKNAEQIAKQYLISHGLKPITENFSCPMGELDLIMQADTTLVFVEVKYRQSQQFGGAIMAISPQKINKLQKTASFYMQKRGFNEYNTDYRFDIVTLDGTLSNPQINWLQNAIL